ncbi:MAG: tetratricopeptide repeat protein [Alphaproteobacteria bacterium]|nr:tetratricopeptide repeat protein [Alphaproteobacteria bacterium]
MNSNEMRVPQGIYKQELVVINKIKFTPREVDVIAFIVNGRTTKKIASFLSISPKTVDNHIHNIMTKLECHSRENIIDFIEKTDKFLIMRQHYLSLLIKTSFKVKLKEISRLAGKKALSCALIPCFPLSEQDLGPVFIEGLKKHLKLAGIIIPLKTIKQYETLPLSLSNTPYHIVLIITDEELKTLTNLNMPSSFLGWVQRLKQHLPSNSFTFLVLHRVSSMNIPKLVSDIGYVEFRSPDNYYFAVLALLKRISPMLDFDRIISDFTQDCARLSGVSGKMNGDTWAKVQKVLHKVALDNVMRYLLKIEKRHVLSFFSLICLLYILFLIYSKYNSHQSMTQFVRSDLIIPFEDTMLDRPELFSKIEESLKGTRPFKTVALVGIAGAGKTTLARQYTRMQTAPVIWEVNAETRETLVDSFENLAPSLSTTEEDQRTLRELQEIKDSQKREGKILQFVKDHLKLEKCWILIYDNVELFPDFLNQFPQDNGTWGQGKVLITTRDSNIQNMRTIATVIEVNELTPSEKLTLFLKILNHGISHSYSPNQTEELNAFLKFIPPFPLDISVAAYYIKSTQINCEKYLNKLAEYKKDFIHIQEDILKKTNDYSKVRYSIITLSLDQLMEQHKDFSYLLLLISLIDSQNIPRNLLEARMNNVSADNFIFNLKKYSLITNYTSTTYPWGTTFSIHRSTQEISLAHLREKLDLKPGNPLIQRIAQNLESYVKQLMEKEDLLQLRILTSHCEMFLNHPQLLTKAIKDSLLSDLGGMYLSLGNYTKAKQVLNDALSKLNKAHHNNYKTQTSAKLAQTLAYLGTVYGDLGYYETAKDFLEQSLLIYEKNLSTNYEGAAWALTYLGNVYRDLGEPQKAKELLERSLHLYKTYLHENHAGNARASAYLGIMYIILGDYEKAKNILEQSLHIYKTYLSKNHVGVAWVSAHLGNAYGELGNYQKARELLEQGIALYKDHFPEDHIKVGWALFYLGQVYRIMGDPIKAQKTLEKSMAIYKKHLSENYVVIAGIFVCLSDVHKDLGEYDKARNLLEKSLLIYEKHFPANHPETAKALARLGDIYRIEGNFEKAQFLLEKSFKSYRQHFSEHHSKVVWVLERLEYVRNKVSDYKKDQAGGRKF